MSTAMKDKQQDRTQAPHPQPQQAQSRSQTEPHPQPGSDGRAAVREGRACEQGPGSRRGGSSPGAALRVWLVDPSLFTAPYDAALTRGLIAAGADPLWITRPTRKADRQELPLERTDPFFYRHVDEATWIPGKLKSAAKGVAHFFGLLKLIVKVRTQRPDVVHMQWIIVPPLDTLAMMVLRRWQPLVLTVHDTVPFNGQKMSWLQRFGHAGPTRLAHRVIVHTRSGRRALITQGVPPEKITVIPHGPLSLPARNLSAAHTDAAASGAAATAAGTAGTAVADRAVTGGAAKPARPERVARDPRWTFVLFGEIKPYKGVSVMIDAVAALPKAVRAKMRVIVAGRPRMDVSPLLVRIAELGLQEQFDMRLQRLTEEEMAALFDEADCFAFPYLQIDASGVYFLVKSLGKWLVASNIGIFAEDMAEGRDGALVPANDVKALAAALRHAVEHRPASTAVTPTDSWASIGRATRELYDDLIAERSHAMPAAHGEGFAR